MERSLSRKHPTSVFTHIGPAFAIKRSTPELYPRACVLRLTHALLRTQPHPAPPASAPSAPPASRQTGLSSPSSRSLSCPS